MKDSQPQIFVIVRFWGERGQQPGLSMDKKAELSLNLPTNWSKIFYFQTIQVFGWFAIICYY